MESLSKYGKIDEFQKPPEMVVKLNWDVAFDIPNKKMGVGVIVKNDAGLVLVSMCTTVPFISNPTTVVAVTV